MAEGRPLESPSDEAARLSAYHARRGPMASAKERGHQALIITLRWLFHA